MDATGESAAERGGGGERQGAHCSGPADGGRAVGEADGAGAGFAADAAAAGEAEGVEEGEN